MFRRCFLRVIFDMLEILKNMILYLGLSREEFIQISDPLMESNRRSLIAFSTLGTLVFGTLSLIAAVGRGFVRVNLQVYASAFILLAVLLLVNLTLSKHSRLLVHFSMYVLILTLLDVGLYLAIIVSPGERTASYLAILTLVPSMFSMRPLNLLMLITGINTAYGLLAVNVQQGDLLKMNIMNAVVFGLMSIAVGTYNSYTRAARYNSERITQLLLETDQMTGVFNRRSYEEVLRIRDDDISAVTVGVFDVNGLKQVNDSRGHEAGDELIRGAAACINEAFRDHGSCYRIGGDEFVVIIMGNEDSALLESMELNFRMAVREWRGTLVERMSISYGIVSRWEMGDCTLSQMVAAADRRMYAAKASYYSDNKLDRRQRRTGTR